jgi:hypothetical protein
MRIQTALLNEHVVFIRFFAFVTSCTRPPEGGLRGPGEGMLPSEAFTDIPNTLIVNQPASQ